MSNDSKKKEGREVVLKNSDYKSKEADNNLIIFKKKCSDNISLENDSKCFVLGYN